MTPFEVLSVLRSLGLQLSLAQNEKLKVTGPVNKVTPELNEEIKRNKVGIIGLLHDPLLPSFDAKPQEFWANLKLDLWGKFGAKLWTEDLLKKDESIRKERARWEYANQGVLFYIESEKRANKVPF